MAQLMIFLYLMALLVRPQDWFGPVMGFPTGYVITLLMFSMGMVSYLSDRPRYAIPHNRLGMRSQRCKNRIRWNNSHLGRTDTCM